MAQENLKLVAVRMSPRIIVAATKMAKREKISFGAFVRASVGARIEILEALYSKAAKG
jgi:hypothetical protein